MTIYDLLQNNEVETTADEFLGYSEDAFTPSAEDMGFRRF